MINFRKAICYAKPPGWLYNLCSCKRYEVKMLICKKTKKLPSPYCEFESKIFLKGQAPTEICEDCVPSEPEYNICQFPVNEIKKAIFWGHGYENLVRDYNGNDFNSELWDLMADEMAKYVNGIRFFAYCTEDAEFVNTTYIPFPKVNGKYNISKLDDDYIEELKARLGSYHKRKLTTQICLFTSIKGRRFQFCPFHGDRNTGIKMGNQRVPTTTDHKAFMRHEPTVAAAKKYIRNMVRTFDNKYIIWELINEPFAFRRQILEKWNKAIIAVLMEEGVPANRIMVEFMGNLGSAIYQFLEAGHWSSVHGVNSLETVQRYHRTHERWSLRENEETGKGYLMIGSGDGGDEFEQRGLTIWGAGEKIRKASSKQMYEIVKFILTHGKIKVIGGEVKHDTWHLDSDAGIEFMSNSAYALPFDEYYTNLRQSIRIATEGLTREECQLLKVDYEENKEPELKQIFKGLQHSGLL